MRGIMRPMYGRPEKFTESLFPKYSCTPTATFAEIFNNRFCSDRSYERAYKI